MRDFVYTLSHFSTFEREMFAKERDSRRSAATSSLSRVFSSSFPPSASSAAREIIVSRGATRLIREANDCNSDVEEINLKSIISDRSTAFRHASQILENIEAVRRRNSQDEATAVSVADSLRSNLSRRREIYIRDGYVASRSDNYSSPSRNGVMSRVCQSRGSVRAGAARRVSVILP